MKKIIYLILFTLIFLGEISSTAATQGEGVVAKVNGKTITRIQINSEINHLIPQIYFHQSVDEEKMATLRKEALDNLIEKELKYQDAIQLGLKVKKRVLKKELKKIIESYPSREAFDEKLKAGNFTEEDVVNEIRRNKLIELAYQKQVIEKVLISEGEAKKYYENNKEKFIQPIRFRLKNILLKIPPLANDFDKKTIQGKADMIVSKIKEGLTFEEAVQEYSEGSDKERGGEMGLLHKGRLAPEVEEAVLALKPGEVAGPFQTFRGFYIFRMEEVLPERLSPFEEVKGKLIKDLTDKGVEDREKIWLEELKNKAEIMVIKNW